MTLCIIEVSNFWKHFHFYVQESLELVLLDHINQSSWALEPDCRGGERQGRPASQWAELNPPSRTVILTISRGLHACKDWDTLLFYMQPWIAASSPSFGGGGGFTGISVVWSLQACVSELLVLRDYAASDMRPSKQL